MSGGFSGGIIITAIFCEEQQSTRRTNVRFYVTDILYFSLISIPIKKKKNYARCVKGINKRHRNEFGNLINE